MPACHAGGRGFDPRPFRHLFTEFYPGDHIVAVPPVPIPNTEVKSNKADGSATYDCARVGHYRDFLFIIISFLNLFFLQKKNDLNQVAGLSCHLIFLFKIKDLSYRKEKKRVTPLLFKQKLNLYHHFGFCKA